jgi:preprotein translocase subunit SecA
LRDYQFEGFEMFGAMIEMIKEEVATYIMKAHVESNLKREAVAEGQAVDPSTSGEKPAKKPVRVEEKAGRNDPCPCGSGKKFKHCHGA